MPASIEIPRRFNGPADSANGGYTCGLLAGVLGADPAEVTLRSPPPLETALEIQEVHGGVAATQGDVMVAEASPVDLELDVPESPSSVAAGEATRAGYESWAATHPFPSCFVCGPERQPGDGMRIFPGRLPGSEAWASSWTPDPSLAEDGVVRLEHVWAALDCPTSAPVANFGQGPPVVLARLAAKLEAPVRPGRPHVIVSWPLGTDGRKRHSAAALFDADGAVLARARALWIQLRA